MTLEQIVTLEPQVQEIFRTAKRTKKRNYPAYEALKTQLSAYVGFHASNPDLRGTECYEISVRHLADILRI